MYSEDIQEELEKKDIDIGDLVKVSRYEGRLMPKPESGDLESIVLKLDNGYNIGVKGDIELVEKREETEVEKTEVEHQEGNPDILLLHTGGTIASRVSYEEGGVEPAFDPEDIVEMYPGVAEEVNIHSQVIRKMYSGDAEPEHWQEIAEKIDEEKSDYDGIIVGHGTDTMEYTGSALTLMLKGIDIGVMLVGSQRSSDRPSSDASMNLYCAIKFLKDTDFQGIGICMHKSTNDNECVILPGAKSRKMHTSRRDAFQAINTDPLGTVNYQTGEIEQNFELQREEYEKRTELETNVGFLKTRPGIEPEEIEFMIEQDYDGVILEGTGLGHMPVNSFDEYTEHHEEILEKLEELADNSLTVMSSKCLNGRIDMDIYQYGLKIQEAGVISAKDMHPELAYVKLMWSLGQAEDREEAEKLFQENFNGEIEERTLYREQ